MVSFTSKNRKTLTDKFPEIQSIAQSITRRRYLVQSNYNQIHAPNLGSATVREFYRVHAEPGPAQSEQHFFKTQFRSPAMDLRRRDVHSAQHFGALQSDVASLWALAIKRCRTAGPPTIAFLTLFHFRGCLHEF